MEPVGKCSRLAGIMANRTTKGKYGQTLGVLAAGEVFGAPLSAGGASGTSGVSGEGGGGCFGIRTRCKMARGQWQKTFDPWRMGGNGWVSLPMTCCNPGRCMRLIKKKGSGGRSLGGNDGGDKLSWVEGWSLGCLKTAC